MSSSTSHSSDSNSEANMRPFQDGLRANDGSEAVNPACTIVVYGATGGTNPSSSTSSDIYAKQKRRKSNPQGWKKNQIKRTKAEGKK